MSKLETNTIDTVSGTTNLTIGSTNTSSITLGASGDTVTVPNGAVTGHMYPAFQAYRNATQNVANATNALIQFDAESFDTDSCYDNSTNYRFTPNVAGKYYVYCQMGFTTTGDFDDSGLMIRKNNVNIAFSQIGRNHFYDTHYTATIIDMNGSTDYLDIYASQYSGGTVSTLTGNQTVFGAYRIGA